MQSTPSHNNDPRSRMASDFFKSGNHAEAYKLYCEMKKEGIEFGIWDNRYMAWCIYHLGIKNNKENPEILFRSAACIPKYIVQETDSEVDCLSYSILAACMQLKKLQYNLEKIASLLDAIDRDKLNRVPKGEQSKDGKKFKYPSALEKYCSEYSKVLAELGRNKECIDLCEYALNNIFEWATVDGDLWFRKRKADGLIALGNLDEAKEVLIPIVRQKTKAFWAWRDFGDAQKDDLDRLSCYCRALECKDREEYKVGLRESAIPLFLKFEETQAASYELQRVLEIRRRNGWKISRVLQELATSEWANAGNEDFDAKAMYKKYSKSAENLLYGDIPLTEIIVVWKNKECDKAGYMITANPLPQDGKAHGVLGGRIVESLKEYSTYDVKLVPQQKGGARVISEPVPTNNKSLKDAFKKSIEGNISIPPGKKFGFVEGIYVHPSFIEKYKISDGNYIKVIAIRSFNRVKGMWSWSVAQIDSSCTE